jgi:hypothetical protein
VRIVEMLPHPTLDPRHGPNPRQDSGGTPLHFLEDEAISAQETSFSGEQKAHRLSLLDGNDQAEGEPPLD